MSDLKQILTSYSLVFLAELPDKTALVALWLSSRYPGFRVFLGTATAFFAHSFLAVLLGSQGSRFFLQESSRAGLTGLSGLILFFFGLKMGWDLLFSKEKASDLEMKTRFKSAFLAGFVSVFFLEFGDLTQVTALLLAAESGKPWSVFFGSFFALISVSGLAIFLGTRLKKLGTGKVSKNFQLGVRWASAGLFLSIGILFIYRAI
jgi:putative Ca2+/H+ antiporter (TMEM165/GDT1 family)